MSNEPSRPVTGRRTVLKGIAGLSVGAATITVLAGCAGESDPNDVGMDTAAVSQAVQQAVAAGQVPVGGAAFLEPVNAVVTQPREGSFMVFSDRCPHQGGRVTRLSDHGTLVCPLHGSEFDLVTGAQVAGPSSAGLQRYDIPVTSPTA